MKILAAAALLFLSFHAFGQKKYCEVVLTRTSLISSSVKMVIHTGDDKQLYGYIKQQDSSFVGKVFNTPVDAVNFMAHNGWDLVTASQNMNDRTETYMYFSREFKPGALHL